MKLIQFLLFAALFGALQTAHADSAAANCPYNHGGSAQQMSPAKTKTVVASLTDSQASKPATPVAPKGNGQGVH
jgi:hypothetical protein